MVINCAAWTDVDGAEDAEEAAFAVNGTGAGNVAAAAAEVGAAVVYVSTDYVFDGAKGAPYVESDQPAPLSRLRPHQAGRRGGDRGRQQAPLHRPLGRPLRDRRQQLRRDDAAARRDHERGPRRPRPGRLADLHLAPRLRHRPADRGDRVRHPPHGRRRPSAPGTNSPARSSSRRRSTAKCSRSPPRYSAGRRRGPPYSALTSQREHAIRLPSWQDGLAGYLAHNDEAEGRQHDEAAGHRRRRIHRLHLRPDRRRRARDRRPRQADLRRPAREPARGHRADRGRDRGPEDRPRGDGRASTRSSTSPPSPTSTARSTTRTPSPAPT